MAEQTETHADGSETPDVPNDSSQHEFPGQLTVWNPGTEPEDTSCDEVPDRYTLTVVETPISRNEYLLPVFEFDCGLHPRPLDASFIHREQSWLTAVFPIDDSSHLVVRRSLKNNVEHTELCDGAAPDPSTATNVVWTAPQRDAAIIDA